MECQNCKDVKAEKVTFLEKPLCADWKKCARRAGRTAFNKRRWSKLPTSPLTNPVYTDRKPGYTVYGMRDTRPHAPR